FSAYEIYYFMHKFKLWMYQFMGFFGTKEQNFNGLFFSLIFFRPRTNKVQGANETDIFFSAFIALTTLIILSDRVLEKLGECLLIISKKIEFQNSPYKNLGHCIF
ncbi:hypothetical protein ACJX0J_027807, partial [Zea mays]